MDSKKILIVAYHFWPQNSPRAFRTYELVRELIKRGIKVDLILPNKEVFVDHPKKFQKWSNLNIYYLGTAQSYNKPMLAHSLRSDNFFRGIAKFIYRYFNPYTDTRSYIKFVYDFLKNTDVKYNLFIAIAHPFSVLVGAAKAIRKNAILAQYPVKVAEYSDPFTLQDNLKMFPLYKLVDKWIANTFDYISIPTEKAISSYLKIKNINHIKVIPQGFDFSEIRLSTYTPNPVPTFGYAGVFYEKIRNPSIFFDYLLTLDTAFYFYIFTSSSNADSRKIINRYKERLGEKLIISYDVPRLDLLKQLSTLDFLINIDNTSNNQIPSKIIDYTLAQRPIYSFSQNTFDERVFQNFINGNYEMSLKVDISRYNIQNVADQFMNIK